MWPCLGTAPCPAGPWMALGGHQDGRTLAATVRAASPASAPYPACQVPRRVGLLGTPTAPGNGPPAATEDPGCRQEPQAPFCTQQVEGVGRGRGSHPAYPRHRGSPGCAPTCWGSAQDPHPPEGGRTSTSTRAPAPPPAPRRHPRPRLQHLHLPGPPSHPSPRQLLSYFLSLWGFAYSGLFL